MSDTSTLSSDWQVVVPVSQLSLEDDLPINGRWEVGDTTFYSRRSAERLLRPPNTGGDLSEQVRSWTFGNEWAFAIVRRTGRPADLRRAVFAELREAVHILASTVAFYSSRSINSGFTLKGYPLHTGKYASFIDTASPAFSGIQGQRGMLRPWQLDSAWLRNIQEHRINELFAVIQDTRLDAAWRRQIRSAAACLGKSMISLEPVEAFLSNIIGLETLLTRRRERNGDALSRRIKGLTGWHLRDHRPDYVNEIRGMHELRCDIVHDSDYGNLRPEQLLLSDVYLRNSLLNIVMNPARFTSKDAMIAVIDDWANNENWPRLGDVELRWVGNPTFSPRELDIPMW